MALGRGIAVGACVGALGLAALGCGAEEHANVARPAAPVRVSVAISEESITVTPSKIAFGEERHRQIEQNEDHAAARHPHQGAADRRLRQRQPDPDRLEAGNPRAQGLHLRPPGRQRQRQLPGRPADRLLHGQRRRHPRLEARPSSWSARTAPPPRTTSCCPSRRFHGAAWEESCRSASSSEPAVRMDRWSSFSR